MALLDSTASKPGPADQIVDFVGVGFGPSNLALAVAAKEIDPSKLGMFFERRSAFDWHPGLLFDSSRMQISFLKDLATLRNPASPFSFIQYTKAKGRLEHFVNLGEFHPTRSEYRDYLRWVAEAFADQVHYGSVVRKVTAPHPGAEGSHRVLRVDVESLESGELSSYWAKNVVYAAGGRPRYPETTGDAGRNLIHSAEFLQLFPQRFPAQEEAFRLGVIGDGQSAGEIVVYLLQRYPNAQIHLFISGYALRPVDRSPFVNEAFFLSEMRAFHGSSDAKRALLSRELRNTNYGVVAPELIDQIYNADYLDAVKGIKRLFTHRFSKLASLAGDANGVSVTVEHGCAGATTAARFDAVVLATGYERSLDPQIFAELFPFIHTDESGAPRLSESCRVQTQPHITWGLYAQGYGESSHGLGDTLLSLLPFRSAGIFEEICGSAGRPRALHGEAVGKLPSKRLRGVQYPPQHHLENDPRKLYAVLESCRFATLISAVGAEPVVTHVPLILDRAKGLKGVLFGHMDRANPHVELLEGGRVLALFHGPNGYISPHVYETDQLPTWNSITVHVRGTVRLSSTRDALLRGLASICETETQPGAYRLDLDHPSIDRLVNFIVGFEIEIEELTGRFKLSQDRSAPDQRLAALHLARRSEVGQRALIEQALGYPLELDPVSHFAVPSNLAAAGPARRRCIHELFEAQVPQSLGRPAILFGDEELSYGELNRQANRLAHYLCRLGVGPETIVGLCLERSPQMLVALLGILKAGAAFVPLDPEFPEERLGYMLRDTAAPVVVTQARFTGQFSGVSTRLVCMDSDWSAIAESPAENPRIAMDPQNLAYCIYTSGSTGRPKAVAIPHAGLVNHILHMKVALRHSASDRVLQFTAITADGSLQEIFTAWLSGAAVVLPAEKAPSVRNFLQSLIRHRVSVVSVPTAYWHFWVGEMSTTACEWPETVRLVILGGEKVIPEKFRQWRRFPFTGNVAWVQDYGPTETTVSCTAFEASPADGVENISIGRPNSNMQIYVLDADQSPVPAGEPGELCIAGLGLGRGYLHQPGLTAEKFVPNPFGAPGTRLYKTGDLARFLPDGNIQFIGRRDEQLKIMGHRIEVGEIESALLRCDGVRQAIVLAHDSTAGGKRLVAYIVADAFDEGQLRQQLSAILPRSMMPAAFIALADLPSTAAGKVDRARLLAIDPPQAAPALADATDLERAVARLWAESTERAARSVDEDFFLAGGDSLRAMSLLNRIAALTGIEVNVGEFLEGRTLRGLAAALRARSVPEGCVTGGAAGERRLLGQLTTSTPTPSPKLRRDEAKRQRASNGQQRLWFLDRLQQGAATYSVPLAYRISGAFSVVDLDRCLTTIVARHEALRTALVMTEDNQLWQEIAPPMDIRSRQLWAMTFADAMQLAQTEASQAIDLATGPLLRSLCIHTAKEEVLWVLTFHHAACDAWALGIFWHELMLLYADGGRLPTPEFQYADYAHWQREWLSTPAAAAHRAFWREQLAGELPPLQFSRVPVPDDQRSITGAMEPCEITGALSRAVRDAAEQHGTTAFVVLLSAFLATLHRFTRQDQLVVGVPVACRSLPETEGIVGYFTNTLPLRVAFPPRTRFSELIRQTSRTLADALAHQELPFDQIVDALECARQGSTNPIFQAMFVMQTTPLDRIQKLAGAAVQEIIVHSGTSKVELTCSIRSTERGLEGELEYSTDVLRQAEARRFVQSFLNLLSASTQDSSVVLEELTMLSPSERDDRIRLANSRFESYPDFRPLHVHVETQALATPDAVAIQIGSTTIAYGALNTAANRLARRLMNAGLRQESLVGICMDRSIGMVTALLGTLKAGAGFVPLDPDYPADRIQTISADARLQLIITEEQYMPQLERLQIPLLIEDSEQSPQSSPNPDVSLSPENIAYVYYTSGSTGTPKGVILDHRGAMNRMEWLRRRYALTAGDRVIQKTPLIFDLAIWEIFGPLMAGATILMADARAESDVTHIGALLSAHRTVFAYFVPSMLEAYLNAASRKTYPGLRWIPVTGEAVPVALLTRFKQHFPLEFHNIYGQTETSELALWEGSRWEGTAMAPIGRPIGIYRLYILDSALNPVPPNVPGEIYVAGIGGLARGYQGLPALTAEKFVPNPHAVVPGERLYRTGDLGRISEDGLMEYVGRTDNQVKVRGCRVETAEVEAIVSQHPSVRACAVVLRNDASGSPRLLAYVAAPHVSASDLGSHVEKLLPRYMLPSAYIFVTDMPLTPSGKIDRSRLPAPRSSDFEARAVHASPESPLETELVTLWEEVLELDNVGRGDNFFSLGGNSLKAIQVIARLKGNFGVDIRVRDFFSSPTIGGLASVVEKMLLAYVTSLSDEEVEQRLGSPA